MRPLILFDDARGLLAPLTDFRPAFDIRTGALKTIDRLQRSLGSDVAALIVPAELVGLTRELYPNIPVNDLSRVGGGEVLLVNGRCVLAHQEIAALGAGEVGASIYEQGSGDLVAAATTGAQAQDVLRGEIPPARHSEIAAPALLSRPWHVKTFRDRALAADLAILGRIGRDASRAGVPLPLADGVTVIGNESDAALHVHPSAKVYPGVILDCENGPIVIDASAVVRPAATIIGPAYIGEHSTVLDRALIKGQTAIGPWCKVAGEVAGTIFQGYANKAHDGHLGDSWIGEWSNLGAGTTNSNLLNTYGEVITKATPGGSNERTGEQFLGCIIGDHVKFAISTRIMTGAVVHSGTMWAATAPVSGCVAGFSWVTDAGVKRFRLDKFIDIAKTVMGRRKVTPTAAYLERLAALHKIPVQ